MKKWLSFSELYTFYFNQRRAFNVDYIPNTTVQTRLDEYLYSKGLLKVGKGYEYAMYDEAWYEDESLLFSINKLTKIYKTELVNDFFHWLWENYSEAEDSVPAKIIETADDIMDMKVNMLYGREYEHRYKIVPHITDSTNDLVLYDNKLIKKNFPTLYELDNKVIKTIIGKLVARNNYMFDKAYVNDKKKIYFEKSLMDDIKKAIVK